MHTLCMDIFVSAFCVYLCSLLLLKHATDTPKDTQDLILMAINSLYAGIRGYMPQAPLHKHVHTRSFGLRLNIVRIICLELSSQSRISILLDLSIPVQNFRNKQTLSCSRQKLRQCSMEWSKLLPGETYLRCCIDYSKK